VLLVAYVVKEDAGRPHGQGPPAAASRLRDNIPQNVKEPRVRPRSREKNNIYLWERNYFLAFMPERRHSGRMKTITEQAPQQEIAGSTGRARTGKIAKLPTAIREELNSRLAEGEATEAVLEWINGLPEVRAHLEAHHQGCPITADNLSRWRQGGYAGWAESVKMQDSLEAMTLACSEMDGPARDALVSRIGTVLMSRLVSQMQAFDAMPDGPEKTRFWGEMVWSYVALRRAELNHEEFKFERKKATMSRLLLQLENESKDPPA
jgi:Protein of unknown function (DUF3486)